MNTLNPIVVSDGSDMDISDSDEESMIGVLTSAQNCKGCTVNVEQGNVNISPSNSQSHPLDNSSSHHQNDNTPHIGTDLQWAEYNVRESTQLSQTLCFFGNDNGPLAVDHSLNYTIDLINDIEPFDGLDDIEELYGPFPATMSYFSSTREASPARDSRIAARQQELARQQEIVRLKLLIAEKEKLKKMKLAKQRQRDQPSIAGIPTGKLPQLSTPSPPPQAQVLASSASNPNPEADEPIFTTQLPLQPVDQQSTTQLSASLTDQLQQSADKMEICQSESSNMDTSTRSPNPQELDRSIDAVTKEIDDSRAALAAAFDESDVAEAIPEIMDGVTELDLDTHPVSTPTENMEIEEEYDSDTSESSYVTAPTSPKRDDLVDEMASLQAAIDEYNKKLEKIQKERNTAHVKVLGLQVRLSLQKNRKASAAATTASASKDVGNSAKDTLLRRRTLSQHRAYIEKPSPPRKITRRAPEIPGPLLTPTAFGQSHPTPEDRPPRNIPPTPPTRARPIRYAQSPRSLHSRISSQSSGVNPIVDSKKLGEYLQDIEELVKLRLSLDDKAIPATQPLQRTPVQPIRLITVDNFTMGLDSVLLKGRRQTKPVNDKNLGTISDNASASKLEQKRSCQHHPNEAATVTVHSSSSCTDPP
ncbi:hypothetical protein BX666DRAFT_532935 [Dichotomocladium elegans]|nr:hypothetical protein BX666DRAFT_532935 [Dichotomocladium elegans]